MTKVCKITGKTPTVGHKVSHSNIKTKKRFDINLKEHRFYIPSQKPIDLRPPSENTVVPVIAHPPNGFLRNNKK